MAACPNESQDEVMKEIGDGTHIDSLPNELLNLITDLVVSGGTSLAVLRLVNKRFKACTQSHLIESLQAKAWDVRSPHDIRSLSEISKVDALAPAIKSLRMTCYYAAYHDDLTAFRQEATDRYFNAIMRRQEKTDVARDRFSMQSRAAQLARLTVTTASPELTGNTRATSRGEYTQQFREHDSERIPEGKGDGLRTIVLPELESRWTELRAENKALFGNVWNFPMTSPSLYGANYDAVARYVITKETLITTIADSLASFKQLSTFAFVEPDIDAWNRYETLFQEVGGASSSPYATGSKRDAHSDKTAYHGMMVGLDIALRAIQRAEIRPNTVTMPAPRLDFQSFTTSVSEDVLRQVLTDTRKLCISRVSERFYSAASASMDDRSSHLQTRSLPKHTDMRFTKKNFPSLRDLTLHFDKIKSESDLESLESLAPGEAAELETLTARYDPWYRAVANAFLSSAYDLTPFHQSLKHLTVVNMFCGNWNDFFRDIAKAQLEKLEIVIETEAFEAIETQVPSYDNVEDGLVCVQELFDKAAEKVEVKPDWVFDLVKRVWRNQDDAVDRLLEDSDDASGFDWEEDEDEEGYLSVVEDEE